MYRFKTTKKFDKSFKKLDAKSQTLALEVIEKLLKGEKLEAKFKDHKLKGDLKDFRECHLKPDLLLIYQKEDETLIFTAINIGSHSELF